MSLDPRIVSPPSLGTSYSSVFKPLESLEDGFIKVFDIAQQHEMLLMGVSWSDGLRTILDLEVCEVDPIFLGFSPKSSIFEFQGSTGFATSVVELCVGSGAMGIGPMFLGAETKVAVDYNKLACTHLRRNQHGMVIEKDLNDLTVISDVFEGGGHVPFMS